MLLKFRSNKIDINKSLFLYYMSLKNVKCGLYFYEFTTIQTKEVLLSLDSVLELSGINFIAILGSVKEAGNIFKCSSNPIPFFFFTLR